ncbi:MAG: transporter [Myxococcota bacterium]
MFFALFLVGAVGHADRAPIVTDRPDVAESSLTVPERALQLETGVEFSGDPDAFGFPTKLRYGALENVELHLEGTIFNRTEGASGLADLDVGGKAHLLDGGGLVPSLAVLFAVTLAIGGEEVSGDQTLLRPTLAAEWPLLPNVGFALNLGLTSPVEDRELFDDMFRFAGAVGIQPGVDGVSVFVELFGEAPLGDGDASLSTDFGATWGVTPDLQLDAYVRVGLSDLAPDLITGGGVSILI